MPFTLGFQNITCIHITKSSEPLPKLCADIFILCSIFFSIPTCLETPLIQFATCKLSLIKTKLEQCSNGPDMYCNVCATIILEVVKNFLCEVYKAYIFMD